MPSGLCLSFSFNQNLGNANCEVLIGRAAKRELFIGGPAQTKIW